MKYTITRDLLLNRTILDQQGRILINLMLDLKKGQEITPLEVTEHFYRCRFDSWMTIDESTHVYVGNSTLVDIPKQIVQVTDDHYKLDIDKLNKPVTVVRNER